MKILWKILIKIYEKGIKLLRKSMQIHRQIYRKLWYLPENLLQNLGKICNRGFGGEALENLFKLC